MALDINQIKADLAEQERLRAAEQERLLDEARKANLEKLAADEVKKRIARINDLEKAKLGLKRQIFDLLKVEKSLTRRNFKMLSTDTTSLTNFKPLYVARLLKFLRASTESLITR